MTNPIEVFNYEGNNVTFYNKDGIVYINANEMAKSFSESKRPSNWLKSSPAQDYIAEVAKATGVALADLQRVTKGGNNPGTWLQEDVALAYAQWLSPKFHVWCNQRIKELMTKGHTELPTFEVPQTFSAALLLAAQQAQQIEQQQQQLAAQRVELRQAKDTAEKYKERASYYDIILHSPSLVPITAIAQDYGLSAKAFNIELKKLGIQYRLNEQWILKARYKSDGYVQSDTIVIKSSTGRGSHVVMTTKWTQKGRRFLYDILKGNGLLPICERQNQDNE
jgi:phage antirepressor YoqD-like protein